MPLRVPSEASTGAWWPEPTRRQDPTHILVMLSTEKRVRKPVPPPAMAAVGLRRPTGDALHFPGRTGSPEAAQRTHTQIGPKLSHQHTLFAAVCALSRPFVLLVVSVVALIVIDLL